MRAVIRSNSIPNPRLQILHPETRTITKYTQRAVLLTTKSGVERSIAGKIHARIGGPREKSISLTRVDIGAAFRKIVVAPLILDRSPRDLKRKTAKWCGTCQRKNHLDIFRRSGDIKSRYLVCAWTRVIAYRVCAAFLPLS